MQKWLLVVILTGQVGFITAQDSLKIMSTAAFLADFKMRDIDAEKIAKPVFGFGVNAVSVIDCRYDTLHLGSIYQDKQRNLWLCFANEQPLSQVITKTFLQKNKPNPLSLLVVIKDFWFTESKDLNKFGQRKALSEVNNNLVCKLEFYQKVENTVVPIVRIDTILTVQNDNKTYNKMATDLIGGLLQLSADKIEKTINSSGYAKRSKLALNEIYSSVKERIEKPILQDSILKKGVYKTKDEFLNNAPSEINYSFKQDKRKFISLYLLDEKGNEYLSRESWGYCDGKTIFINNKGMYDPLYRIDNAFYWRAFRTVKTDGIPISTPFIPIGNGTSVAVFTSVNVNYDSRILYLLNLETGEHY